jgi:protein-tyrosine phosphatase
MTQELFTDLKTYSIQGIAETGKFIDIPIISHIEGNLYMGGCIQHAILPEIFKFVVSVYPWEKYAIQHKDVNCSYNYLYDQENLPDERLLDAISSWIVSAVSMAPTLVHCQAGLNRSSLVTARALMKMGRTAQDVISLIRTQRSELCLCNSSFEQYLMSKQ